MPFFTFMQNNSGGSFDHQPESGIGYAVAIEAETADEANAKAQLVGIYFDGVSAGRDCDCCGDRWDKAWEDDGDDEPLMHGKPLVGGWGISSYIHYADGRIEERAA